MIGSDEGHETKIRSGTTGRPDLPVAEATGTPAITGLVSFLSSTERHGRWTLPRHMRALAVMGNVELDLRDADVPFGLSVIEAVAVLGNIEVTVPPEVSVECEGDALLGNFSLEYAGRVNTSVASRDRIVRITGTAYLASVTVKVKGPDEDFLKRLGRTFGRDRR